jgi:N6-adenosine-specific RNA methylase IME4
MENKKSRPDVYPFHPLASMFPVLEGEELERLAENIRQHGLGEQIHLYEGKVLDGRNRLRACQMVGVEPRFRGFKGSRRDALNFIWSKNLVRRHLSPSQAAAAFELRRRKDAEFAAEVKKLQAEAKEKQRAAGSRGGEGGRGNKKTPGEKVPQGKREQRRSSTALAKSVGTNRKYLEVARDLPDATLEALRDSKVAMPEVIREQARRANIADLEDVKTKEAKAVEGVFDVVVVDPPWKMKKSERNCRPEEVGLDYSTMTLDEIRALKIPAAADCHLFLWTTQKYLLSAGDILAHWGARYVCSFVWHKRGGYQPFGLPQFNCEFCLYGRIGHPTFIDTKNFPTCFTGRRRGHSVKPEEFYEVLRRVTAGRRLDMFSRRRIEEFESWGLEAPQ